MPIDDKRIGRQFQRPSQIQSGKMRIEKILNPPIGRA